MHGKQVNIQYIKEQSSSKV